MSAAGGMGISGDCEADGNIERYDQELLQEEWAVRTARNEGVEIAAAEVLQGVQKNPDPAKRRENKDILQQTVS